MQKIQTIFILIWLVGFYSAFGNERYIINAEKSSLKWRAEKFMGIHYGRINFLEGELIMQDDKIVGGFFAINMRSIVIDDFERGKWYDKFLNHLKSESFFYTEKYPSASLKITKSIPISDSTARISAILKIKGIENDIEFVAKLKSDNGEIQAKTILIIDRKKYNIGYGSQSILDQIGDGFLFDDFQLDINIILTVQVPD